MSTYPFKAVSKTRRSHGKAVVGMAILDIVWFVVVFILAIKLIEYQGDWWVDTAGDLFGALGLMFLAVERALR